jgi:hypothetical protein
MTPVCWIREDGVIAFHEQKEVDSQGYKWNPLYMLRELSDEKIKSEAKLFCHTWFSERPERLILFARTIERIQRFIIRGLEKVAFIQLIISKIEKLEQIRKDVYTMKEQRSKVPGSTRGVYSTRYNQ